VRQRWDTWQVDMLMPMVYHEFYEEELDWIGFATGQGVRDLKGSNTALYTGVFLPDLKGEELEQAIQYAREHGAQGVSLFHGGALTEAHLEILKSFKD